LSAKATELKFSCPECDRKFLTATGLGSHRKNAHGVAGTSAKPKEVKPGEVILPGEVTYKCPDCPRTFTSPNAIGVHRLRAHGIGMGGVKVKQKHRCPDCDHKPFDSAVSMASHRRAAHGIVGQSEKSKLRHLRAAAKAAEPQALSCEFCDFQAKTLNGLAIHIGTIHKRNEGAIEIEPANEKASISEAPAATTTAVVKVSRNGYHAPEAVARRGLIPEATLAYTAGRVEELLSRTAAEYDLPSRTFTTGVIELIYAKTLRR
jgi:uncharacterized C2H2 Zn-finger protein